MKVTIADREYCVQFQHFMKESKNKNKKRFITYCKITLGEKEVYKAFAKLNPIDKLNRNLGKAKSLQNLFKKYPFTKEFRVAFWTEFHNNFKI